MAQISGDCCPARPVPRLSRWETGAQRLECSLLSCSPSAPSPRVAPVHICTPHVHPTYNYIPRVCMYHRLYAYTQICTHTHTQIDTCTHMCTYQTCTHALHPHRCTYTWGHRYLTHICTHTPPQTHTHVLALSDAPSFVSVWILSPSKVSL